MKKIVTSKIIFRGLALLIIINFVKSPKDAWIVLASFCLTSGFICSYLFIQMFKDLGKVELYKPSGVKKIFDKSKYSFFITIIPAIYQNVSVLILSFSSIIFKF